jgi:hypothetical protein
MLNISRAAVLSTPTFARYFSASAVVSRWLFSFYWYNLVPLIQSCFTDTVFFHWYNLLSLIQSSFIDTILFHWYNLLSLIQSCFTDTILFHWYNLLSLIQSWFIDIILFHWYPEIYANEFSAESPFINLLNLMLRQLCRNVILLKWFQSNLFSNFINNLCDYFSMWLNYLIVPYFVISFGCTLDANFN